MSLTPEEHDYIGQVIAEDAAERAPRNRRVTAESAPVPPAGDVEVLGWVNFEDGRRGIDWYREIVAGAPVGTELVDRAHVTRLTAERDGLLAEVKSLSEHRDELKIQRDRWVRMHNNLQSELTKARDALAGMVEYFPEGHSDGECFSVERAKAVLAHQSAPAAKGERYECIGKGGDYQVVAIAQGAGTLKGFNHYVYKNADGVHFVRDPEDFLLRMQVKP